MKRRTLIATAVEATLTPSIAVSLIIPAAVQGRGMVKSLISCDEFGNPYYGYGERKAPEMRNDFYVQPYDIPLRPLKC